MNDPDDTLAQVKQKIAPLRERLLDRDMHPERTAVWLARTVPSESHTEILEAITSPAGGLWGAEPHDSEAAVLLRAAMLTEEEKEEYRRRPGS
jgi:hypothetical protein